MLLKAALVVAAAQTAILIGIFFVSGQLLPNTLAGLYAAVPKSFWRLVIASVLIFPLGNWATGLAYAHYNPALVSPLMIGSMIILNTVFTILILNIRPSLWIIPATVVLTASGVWLSILLQQKS